jgi:tetratricopeptide (TPR) repeat protein/transcriptional regulator with XRE-family HTH domain
VTEASASGDRTLAGLLRDYRAAANLTQEELAERSGMSVHAIAALERGVRRSPRTSTVEYLAGALKLDAAGRASLVAAARGRPDPGAQDGAGPRDDVPPPEPRAGLPPGPAVDFVGRERELAVLRRRLVEGRRVAVHGLGGIGKTQLAASYLDRHRADYPDGAFWIRSDREDSIVADLASLAWRLGLPERRHRRIEDQLEAVLRWLREHARWLLVLDNVEPEAAEAVRHWLPQGLPGHLLVTSRMPMWPVRLRLGPLPLETARTFLLRRTGQADRHAAGVVAERLGCLPLALAQAASYVDSTGRDLAGYAELLRTSLDELLGEGRPEDHPDTVTTTWRLSFDHVEGECAPAAGLLRLCAFLAPDDISTRFLERGAGELPVELRRVVTDAIEFDRTVAALQRYSLVERNGEVLGVHRLVQAVVRGSLPAAQRATWLGSAIRVLRASFPDGARDSPDLWADCTRLLPHVQTVALLSAGDAPEPLALATLLNRAGTYLDARAQFGLARPLLERALAVRERVLGDGHPDVAESLNNLAGLSSHTGDLAGALRLYERALAMRERAMGPDHPATATSLNDMAVILHRQGELIAARALYERALSIDERALGPDHIHTAMDLNNLARLLKELREPAAARSLLQRALAICERTLAADHPLTATTLNNLALLLRDQHELAAARPVLERSVGIYEQVLGDDHPHTAIALANLSGLLREQGEVASAVRTARRSLGIQLRALGGDHPDVAVGLITVALALRARGGQAGARRLLQRGLALRDRVGSADDQLTAAGRRALDEITRGAGGD